MRLTESNSKIHPKKGESTLSCLSLTTGQMTVSEIKVLSCAPTGCTSPKIVHPEIHPCTLLICSNGNYSKIVHTPGAHLRKTCTRLRKCARRVQGAPLISDTEWMCLSFYRQTRNLFYLITLHHKIERNRSFQVIFKMSQC